MAVTINASTSAGLISSADTSGILQLQTANTTALTIDASQNVGLGVTPSAWGSTVRAFQIGTLGSFQQNDAGSFYGSRNSYNSSTGYKYLTTNTAQLFGPESNGGYAWYQAASGTAGNAITWTQAMTLDVNGSLLVGTTGAAYATSGRGLIEVGGTTSALIALKVSGTPTSYWACSSSSTEIGTVTSIPLTFFSNNAERVRITSAGDFLWNKTTASSSNTGINFENDGSNVARLNIGGASSAGGTGLSLYSTTAGAFRFFVSYSGTINATNTSITAISDQSLKENIRDLDTGLSEVMALRPRRFDWKEETQLPDRNVAGFIAQEVSQVLPELVYDYMYSEGVTKKSLKMGDMLPTLVKAIQEQQALITQLQADVAALKGA
jgi:hypothetical protein